MIIFPRGIALLVEDSSAISLQLSISRAEGQRNTKAKQNKEIKEGVRWKKNGENPKTRSLAEAQHQG